LALLILLRHLDPPSEAPWGDIVVSDKNMFKYEYSLVFSSGSRPQLLLAECSHPHTTPVDHHNLLITLIICCVACTCGMHKS